MGVLEQKAGDAVQLIGIVRHEFPAVVDFRRGLVAGTVRERVDRNDLAALAIPEGVVEGIQFAVDCPVPVPLLDPLLAPVAVFVAGGIGDDCNRNGLPELEQGVAMAFLVGERDRGRGWRSRSR